MPDPLLSAAWEFIREAGVPGLLLLALVGLYRGWWVPGNFYQKEVERGNKWERIALENTNLIEKGFETTREVVEVVRRPGRHAQRSGEREHSAGER